MSLRRIALLVDCLKTERIYKLRERPCQQYHQRGTTQGVLLYLSCISNELEQEARAGRADVAAVQAVGVPVDRDVAPAHWRQAQQSMLAPHIPTDATRDSGSACVHADTSSGLAHTTNGRGAAHGYSW